MLDGGAGDYKNREREQQSSFVQFGTMVYKNPYHDVVKVQNISNSTFNTIFPLTLIYVVYGIIIILQISLVAILILYKKKKIL